MNFNDLSPDLQAQFKACATPDEIVELAEAEGYELSDAQLAQISGGNAPWDEEGDPYLNPTCPQCGSKVVQRMSAYLPDEISHLYECQKCWHRWEVKEPR